MIIDLHQDISTNALVLSHKDFFKKWSIDDWRNAFDNVPSYNQSDYYRLKEQNVKVIFWASCLLPEQMGFDSDITRYLIRQQIKYYRYIVNRSKWDIEVLTENKQLDNSKMKILLHLEWYYYSNPKESCLNEFYKEWVRSIAFSRDVSNNLIWWKHDNYWLTKEWFSFLNELSNYWIILDLAHINDYWFDDIVKFWNKPLLVSHTQLRSFKNDIRNISDENIIKVADSWWTIWLMPHSYFLWKSTLEEYIDSILYIRDLVWIEHVSLWSDFDWFWKSAIIEGFSHIWECNNLKLNMIYKWLNMDEINKFFYWNSLRVIKEYI